MPSSVGLTEDEAYELTRVRGEILRPLLMSNLDRIRSFEPEVAQRFVGQVSQLSTRKAKEKLGLRR